MTRPATRAVSIFGPTHWDEKLNVLAAEAERIFRARYTAERYPALDFHAPVWDFARSDVRSAHNPRIHFTDADDTPLPPSLALALKAYIAHTMQNPRHAHTLIAAAMPLWRVLRERAGTEAVGWHLLTESALLRLDAVLQEYAAVTRDSYLDRLRRLVEWLEIEAEVVGSLNWPLPKGTSYTDAHRSNDGRRQRAMRKLPTTAAMRALGMIYRHHARTPQDRLLICVVGLMALTGFRIAEVVALPLECIERRVQRGSERVGIRYWNRKTGGSEREYAVRWLSPLGAELALELIAEIRALTEDARALARASEAAGDRVPIPYGDAEWLVLADVQRALGISSNTFFKQRVKGRFRFAGECRGPRGAVRVPRAEVECMLRREQGPLAVRDVHGELHSLADCLLCLPKGFFHTLRKQRGLLVEELRANVIRLFLAGDVPPEARRQRASGPRRRRSGTPSKYRPQPRPSVFARFDMMEERRENGIVVERRPCRIHPHQLRHWLNTLAYQGGMSLWEITTWMQRANPHHTRSYAHSAADTADRVRHGVEEGTLLGPVARAYAELDEEGRARLSASLEEAAKTATGYCGMRLTIQDCPRYKTACENCEHWSHDPTEEAARVELRTRSDHLGLALVVIERRKQAGVKVHPRQESLYHNWLGSVRQRLDEGDALLRRMEAD